MPKMGALVLCNGPVTRIGSVDQIYSVTQLNFAGLIPPDQGAVY
jgi:hypothetical protein